MDGTFDASERPMQLFLFSADPIFQMFSPVKKQKLSTNRLWVHAPLLQSGTEQLHVLLLGMNLSPNNGVQIIKYEHAATLHAGLLHKHIMLNTSTAYYC